MLINRPIVTAARGRIWRDQMRPQYAATLLVLVILAFYLAVRRDGHEWGGDFSLYIMLARNVASLHRYGDTPFVYDPEAMLQSPRVYPPGFPILLAPAYALFGLNFAAFKVVCLFLLAGSLVSIYLIGRSEVGDRALWLIPLNGLTYPFLSTRDSVGSESCYMFFSYAGLAYAMHAYATNRDVRSPWRSGLITGALFGYTYMSRTVGIALPMALAAYDVLRYRRLTRYLIATGLAFLMFGIATSLIQGANAGYPGQFSMSIGPFTEHLLRYLSNFSYAWVNGYSRSLRYVTTVVVTLIAGLGLLFGSRDRVALPVLYAGVYVCGISAYFATTFRYLLPIVPVYLLLVVEGLVVLRRARWPRVGPVLATVASAMMALTTVANLTTLESGPILNGVTDKEFHAVCDFLTQNVDAADGVLSWNPRVFALYSDRRSVAPLSDTSRYDIRNYYVRNRVRYQVISLEERSDRVRAAFVAQHGSAFRPVYSNVRYRVYRVDPSRLEPGT